MRKTMVVRTAAVDPTIRVRRDGSLAVPFWPRRSMKRDVSKARKLRPAAMGWITRAAVVVREIRFWIEVV